MSTTTSLKDRARRRLGRTLAIASIVALGLTACADGGTGGGTAGGGTGGDGGETYTFTFANGALDGTQHAAIQTKFLDMVEERTDGRVTFDRTSFEALCKLQEIVECIRDGRADIGTTIPDYTPQMFPSSSIMNIPYLNTDMQAAMSAMYEMHTNNPAGTAIMDRNGLHYVAWWPVGTVFLGSKTPLTSIADLQGLSGRASGPVLQATLQNAGMNITAVTAAETYEAVERGVIDSIASALDFGTNYKLNELLPYWTDPGLGQYSAYGMWWNASAYDSLPDDLKQIVDEVTAELNGGVAIETFNEATESVCQGMLDAPGVQNMTKWDDAAADEWKQQIGTSGEELWVQNATDWGLTDAQAFLNEYKAAYEANVDPGNIVDATAACVDKWEQK